MKNSPLKYVQSVTANLPRFVKIGILLVFIGACIGGYFLMSTKTPSQTCPQNDCKDEAAKKSDKKQAGKSEEATTPSKDKEAAKEATKDAKAQPSKPGTVTTGAPSSGTASDPAPSTGGGGSGGSGGGGSTPGTGNGPQVCAPFPAFPDESCTGVPSSMASSLQTINGSLSTSSNNQVIDGKLITDTLVINHDNVTVKNSRIFGRIAYNGHRGLTVQDSEIGPNSCPASNNGGTRLLLGDDFTLTRVHMHNNGDDLIALGGGGTVLIQDSLMNNTCYYAGDHLDAIQYYDPGGVANVTINHNRIDARPANVGGYGNAAVFWADNPGAGTRLTMNNNLFAGGNYTVYALDAPAGSGVILDINNNRFIRNTYTYGPCTSGNAIAFNGSAGIKWTGNAYSDGAPIPLSDC